MTTNFTRLEEANRGEVPTALCRLDSGWVFFGDSQFLAGYSILFADPMVGSLGDLDSAARAAYLRDYALLGDAVQAVTGAVRINYSILGNVLPILHGHIFPRYDSEDAEFRPKAVWTYPDFEARSPRFNLARDAELMARICAKLEQLGANVHDLDYPWLSHV
ncbi:MAG: diadenosine tetraphosphate (Ap4A) HIT family hydrolase [Planctomycetota bacterium]|jgi:diadenosine tetraphosphate (Ap4A) HIT family hydrolase